MPRSISVGIIPFFSRLYYRLKAQLVPVDPDLVVDGDGKSMLRASETLIFQPKQSIAAAPIFNTYIEFEKKKFGSNKIFCRASLTIPNSIYKAGQTAAFNLRIDNSLTKHTCHVYVTQ